LGGGVYCLFLKVFAIFAWSAADTCGGPVWTVSFSSWPVKRNGTW
jgi:hypothetical protein